MRTSTLLALPALVAAQQQIPLLDQVKGWFAKAADSLSAAIPSAPSAASVPNPVASGAAKVASLKVQPLTIDNYDSILQPGAATASPGTEPWMVFVTGGNKTCYGACERAETQWNESVALLSASPKRPNLALLDCEVEGPLCHAWFASPPSVLYIELPQPQPDQSTPATTVRYIPLNRTAVTAPEIAALHVQEEYKDTKPYEGFFHPFDGVLAQNKLALPVGWGIFYFSKVPSWAFMVGISFLSRTFMSRRMGPQGGAGARPAAAPAAQ
ncbi:hypothetical protein Tdes44962_MAKER03988 [Teratosphaeria destructans]|uniref:Peptidyl-tRNA hydrolase n=1 Tax=Teratosphaeria destructans TaxID=418781 RepID=A0A9W7SNR0_9PEZI|nr:hypothetical protein Tdes44962_MAKER03988 [Teratosphaeria destructans]